MTPAEHVSSHSAHMSTAPAASLQTVLPKSDVEPEAERLWTQLQQQEQLGATTAELFETAARAIDILSNNPNARHSPAALFVWLAYIELHREINQDEDECRQLFKYLKNSHAGLNQPEYYLYAADSECRVRRFDKAIVWLQATDDMLTLRAIPSISAALALASAEKQLELPRILQRHERPFFPSQAAPFPSDLMTPRSVGQRPWFSPAPAGFGAANAAAREDFKPPIPPPSTARLRRIGLGPPKRAIVSIEERQDDSTVPHNSTSSSSITVGSRDDQSQSSPSNIVPVRQTPTNSPLAILDNDNMSMTKVQPSVVRDIQEALKDESFEEPKTRIVRINGRSYRVLQLIGRGGSSKVFRVMTADGQMMALKKVGLRNLDDTTLAGYLNEIELLHRLADNPHIIRLIDSEIQRDHGNLYILMEFGETDLCRMLRARDGKPRDDNFIRFVWQQMLVAVRDVHSEKIVHCDLKPANFLLVQGVLKLIDFGISKAIMNDTTNIVRENQVGTVNYMSPEALQESSSGERGRLKIGRSSDVWSLGCILYELTYGKPPFAAFSLVHRLQRIMDPTFVIEYPPLLDNSADLLAVIKNCLERDPKQRLTIDQLLAHPFLVPTSQQRNTDTVLVSKSQISSMLQRFAQMHPDINATQLTERIFEQWKKDEVAQ